MHLTLKTSRHRTWGKCHVRGIVVGKDSQGREIQELKETIYYLGRIRIVRKHEMKFVQY